jgi:hypothetical protein
MIGEPLEQNQGSENRPRITWVRGLMSTRKRG